MSISSLKDISGLPDLENAYKNKEIGSDISLPPAYMSSLHNNANAAKEVCEWVNRIISEYNALIEEGTAKKYNIYIFHAFKEIMPFLTTYGQMIVYANLCALCDDDVNKDAAATINEDLRSSLQIFHDDYFLKSLKEANKKLLSGEEANKELLFEYPCSNSEALFNLGYLNFRAQNLDEANVYLTKCVEELEKDIDENAPDKKAELYTNSVIFLSNCYEYKGYCNKAIEQLLGTAIDSIASKIEEKKDKIFSDIQSKYINGLDNIAFKDIVEIIRIFSDETSKPFKVLERFIKIEKNEVKKTRNAFIHVLAHCLSEYAAQIMKNEEKTKEERYPICYSLQSIARFLIDWITHADDSYITCQATVRAENEACQEALDILRKKNKKGFSSSHISEEEKKRKQAELDFYIFYFAEQEFRFSYNPESADSNGLLEEFNKHGNAFKNWAEKAGIDKDNNATYDFDALLHYWVIQFKFLLKKGASLVLRRDANVDFKEVDEAYTILLKIKSRTQHAFQSLIIECERLEALYLAFRQFRYLNDSNTNNENCHELNHSIDAGKSLKKISSEQGVSKKLTKLYHEIDRHDKILILAPVYWAPSCSFSIKNIDELIEIGKESFDEKVSANDIRKTFNKISGEHKPDGKNSYVLSSNLQFTNIIFGLFIDSSKHARLCYKGFENNKHGKMVPVDIKLNNIEFDVIKNKLKVLSSSPKSSFKLVDCKEKDCPDDESDCITYIYRMKNNAKIDTLLADLLAFMQFDLAIDSLSNLVSISFRYSRSKFDCRIIGYAIDITSLNENQICKLAYFQKIEVTPDQSQNNIERDDEQSSKLFDHEILKKRLEKLLAQFEENDLSESEVKKCKELIAKIKLNSSQEELKSIHKSAKKLFGDY
jgi:hypothetical protein